MKQGWEGLGKLGSIVAQFGHTERREGKQNEPSTRSVRKSELMKGTEHKIRKKVSAHDETEGREETERA